MTAHEADAQIQRYGLLDGPPRRDLQALVDLAAEVFDVPFAALNIITSSHQHQVATTGFPPAVCVRPDSMCAAVLEEPDAVVVADARQDGRFAENPFVTGEIGSVRFYASAQLATPAGVPLGRLCVFDDHPRRATSQQRQALTTLAGRVMDALELQLKNQELEAALAELTRARDELRRSNAALLHFAGQVSHDLRNPLMAVSANAELLSGEPAISGDAELSAVVHRILGATRDMDEMVNHVLHQATEGGRPRPGHADLLEVARRVLRDLEPHVARTGATVQLGDLPTVTGDPELLYVALLNLVGNSLKFARPDRPPVVSVTAARHSQGWRISVTDNGVGVPAGQERTVFLPYARGHHGAGQGSGSATAATQPEGHGIGLATVHRVITGHGGQVGLDPVEDGGTTVWFTLPVNR